MNISSTQFSLKHTALEFYISGCTVKCPGCHNYELWDFNLGKEWKQFFTDTKIEYKIAENSSIIDKFVILGGEPLDQDINELKNFLLKLKTYKKEIWLFTSYTEIPRDILELVEYVKYGKYDEKLKVNNNLHYGYNLITSNQYITKVQ